MSPAPERTEITTDMEERRWFYYGWRDAVNRSGSAYGLSRSPDNRWFIEVYLPGNIKRRMFGVPELESGLKAQDYCVRNDTQAKIALMQLDENGDTDQLEKLRSDAITMGELPKRRMRLTIDVDVMMRGTDEEIKYYVCSALRSAPSVVGARVTFIDGPKIEEPRPTVQS